MSDVVIAIEELGKRYRLGELDPYRNLGDILTRAVSARLRRGPATENGRRRDYHWALSDISLDVHRGEILGIVGRNGAGKSTLLKILSRVTRPTTGKAHLRGRVGSLLEVGTGFHPELTGRENIYLNGVILGMKRHEIARSFDEIVEFAGVGEFLDTPVKRYSSGMHVRLAFAVAAHLQAEILIIDEVLSVGDAEFQRRSVGKIGDVVHQGRTVLFVSHNLGAVRRLCRRAVLLEDGRLAADGPAGDVVARYLATAQRDAVPAGWINVAHVTRRGTGRARVTDITYTSGAAGLGFSPYTGGPLEVTLAVESDTARSVGSASIILYDVHGTKLVNADTLTLGESVRLLPGTNYINFRIERLHLNPGPYLIGWGLNEPPGNNALDFVEQGVTIEVVDDDKRAVVARPWSEGVVACDFSVGVTRNE